MKKFVITRMIIIVFLVVLMLILRSGSYVFHMNLVGLLHFAKHLFSKSCLFFYICCMLNLLKNFVIIASVVCFLKLDPFFPFLAFNPFDV